MKKSYRKWAEKEVGSQLRLVALTEVVRQELREFVVSAGMVALATLLEKERTDVCGPRYRHQSERAARRGGHVVGELVLGGRRVRVRRPRARTMDGREVELPSWKQFSVEDPLHERALTQMLVGVSTRKYDRSLDRLRPQAWRSTSRRSRAPRGDPASPARRAAPSPWQDRRRARRRRAPAIAYCGPAPILRSARAPATAGAESCPSTHRQTEWPRGHRRGVWQPLCPRRPM